MISLTGAIGQCRREAVSSGLLGNRARHGWGLRAGPADGCDAAGQKVDFPKTKADREATGEPRLSIAERYYTHEMYVNNVTRRSPVAPWRLLMEEDVER